MTVTHEQDVDDPLRSKLAGHVERAQPGRVLQVHTEPVQLEQRLDDQGVVPPLDGAVQGGGAVAQAHGRDVAHVAALEHGQTLRPRDIGQQAVQSLVQSAVQSAVH